MNESDIPIAPPEVVEAFTSAALTALRELTQIEAFADHPPRDAAERSENMVSAALRLLRPVPGTLLFVLTAPVAERLAARYLPPDTELTDEMIGDVVGEFANVIAGQAKTILKGTLYHFSMSTPVVTRAASLAQLPGARQTQLITALDSELGQLLLLVDLPPCPHA